MNASPFKSRAVMTGVFLFGGLLLMTFASGSALAYSPEGDLMKIKGYSPEVIDATENQRSRQEWKATSVPQKSPVERFFHNVYYGNWTGDIDQFGSKVLRGD